MRRASDPTRSRASDWATPPAWAPDPEQGFGRAADSDTWPARAPDPRAGWDGRAWPAPDRNQAVPPLRLGHAGGLFCAAKTAEGLSPRSIAWYGAILDRLGARFGPERPVDDLTPIELRAWLVDLRATLAPISVAGYVRGLRAFGNWLAQDGLAEARALRTLARPRVPHKVMEPLADEDLRRLIAASDVRDRAIVLLLLDTGLRVSEAAGISLADLRPDGTIKVLGKGARERVVGVGAMAERTTIDGMLADARRRIERLPPDAAYRALGDGALLVDTRCAELRRAEGAIPGSVHVPLSVLFWRLDPSAGHGDPALSDLARPVVLICAHGYSSSLAAATLRDLGFASVADVIGGFEAWSAAGLPVEPGRSSDSTLPP